MFAFPPSEPTGVPGLDAVLGGGLLRRGIAFVVGAPGTGKTILVQQLAFAAARAGRPALYFSGLSEPNERLVEHLRPFTFFDGGRLGDDVQLLSLSSALDRGEDSAVEAVMRTARRTSAGLVIIDSFRGLRDRLTDEREVRNFLYRLGAQIGILGALLIVVLEGEPPAPSLYPELSAGDILIGLFLERGRVGHRRYLEVYKRRGGSHLSGLHPFTIGPDGVACYPQFELTVPTNDVAVDLADRAAFGIPELDAMLRGGLVRRTTTVLAGDFGTGKTTLGLQFLAEGVARGERGLFVSFRESGEQLAARAAMVGTDLAEAIEQGRLWLLTRPAVALDPDILAHGIRDAVAGGGTQRLVLDSLAEPIDAVGQDRTPGYLAALGTALRQAGVTSLLIAETSGLLASNVDFTAVPTSALGDNLLLLRNVETEGTVDRMLTVVKMRFSDHDRATRAYTIDERGVALRGRPAPQRDAPPVPTERGGDSD
jgi:circadian clock protein KaiC